MKMVTAEGKGKRLWEHRSDNSRWLREVISRDVTGS